MVEQVAFATIDQLMTVFGPYDANVSLIERALDVKINARDKQVEVRGEKPAVNAAVKALQTLQRMAQQGEDINDWAVSQAVETAANGDSEQVLEATRDVIAVTYQGKPVKCKTIGQTQYIRTHPGRHYHHLHRPGRHRQNLSCHRHGRSRAQA